METAGPAGMLTTEDLERRVESGEIDTVVAAFIDHYGRLHGKRFDAAHFIRGPLRHGAHACDYLLTTDMEMTPVPGYDYANWEAGYGDFHMEADLATLRVASWLDRTALVLCDVLDPRSGELVPVAPRSILRRQLEKASAVGLSFRAASELEYYLFLDSYREAAESGYRSMKAAGWYIEDYHLLQGAREEFYNGEARRRLAESGVPVESSKGEWGRGQHEMNIEHAEMLEMADRHVVMKQAMKEIADGLGVSVTFMAKPSMAEAGSSCHLHVSAWREGRNAFEGPDRAGPVGVSDTFRWFLGGWMRRTPELTALMAPTVNSYKRYQDGSWAPTRVAWSYDNRTAGFRVVGSGRSLRIESRIPGGDVNPYLAYAAVVAAGLDGVADRVEPPEMYEGDAYRAEEAAKAPGALRDAADLFEASEFVRESFGSQVQDHYTRFFRMEQEAFDNAVTDWERERYFERI